MMQLQPQHRSLQPFIHQLIKTPRVYFHLLGEYKCGVSPISHSNIRSRIVDETEAAQHSIPWQAEIGFFNIGFHDNGSTHSTNWIHHCGGTILSENYILSAGHCSTCAHQCKYTACRSYDDCDMQRCCVPSRRICLRLCKSGKPSHAVVQLCK